MSKFYIVLFGGGGELDRKEVEPTSAMPGDDVNAINDTLKAALDEWTLSPGDTIRIIEED